jgi:serine/threonine-protein kinase PknG
VLAKLTIEPSVRVPLVRQLVGQALRLLDEGLAAPDPDVLLATVPFEEEQLRTALERSLRALATMAPSAEERYRLVDEANTSRPRTLT